MNILLVITGLGMGGAETQTVSLADQFAARGHNVTIAYILKPAIVLPRSEKVNVFWLEGEKSAFSMAKAYINLAKIINQFKPDVVHSHMFHANILSRLARLISRVPRLICTAHNTNEGGKLRMLAYRVTHALGDEFTNVSQEAVEAFEHKKAAPVGHMLSTHNGIDTQRLSFNPVAVIKEFFFSFGQLKKSFSLPIIRNDAHLSLLVAWHQFHTAPIFLRCSSTRAESVASSLASRGSGVA